MIGWNNIQLQVEVIPTKKIWWAKWAKIGPKISFFVIDFKFGSLVHHSLEHCLTTSRGKIHGKIPNWVQNCFCHFLKLRHYIFLILHKITAWDNVQHPVELKPPKKIFGRNWGPNDLFYSNVVKHPLDLILLGVSHVFKGSSLFFLLDIISRECLFYKKIIFPRNSNDKIC